MAPHSLAYSRKVFVLSRNTGFKTKYEPAESVEKDRKVNVIIIQNEAWWNPALLKNVNYSVDLMEGINSLSENVVRGTFVTPVYAGGTCLPEFEVLTGIPMLFMPTSVYPYTQYVTHKTPSIVSAYKDNGYQTVALHPYRKNFYNRSTAYPLLGFMRSFSLIYFRQYSLSSA